MIFLELEIVKMTINRQIWQLKCKEYNTKISINAYNCVSEIMSMRLESIHRFEYSLMTFGVNKNSVCDLDFKIEIL